MIGAMNLTKVEELQEHYHRQDNPHNVTLEQLGLNSSVMYIDGETKKPSGEAVPLYNLSTSIEIPEGADLNSYTTPGTYICISDSIAKTVKNTPSGTETGFELVVERIGSTQCVRQHVKLQGERCVDYSRFCNVDSVGKWCKDGAASVSLTITLDVSKWIYNKQEILIDRIDPTCTVIVTPEEDSQVAYARYGVYCSAQGAGVLTFNCESTPLESLNVKIVIMEV